ncbi:MAG TPA: type II toxin-antitoxin system HicB family antitoxin [Geminicoccaceae bacterium]|nr:type II toxin-antitoxin system HicB family antitoxin [Geminicoccaceae bacterium]
MKLVYPIEIEELTPEDGGGLLVHFPDWGGAVTEGDDRDEALANAADCLEELVADRINRREDLPAPSPPRGRPTVALPGRMAGKAALWLALRERGVSLNELARRLGQPSTLQVRRLLDPKRHSRADLLDEALAALGKRLAVEVQDAA